MKTNKTTKRSSIFILIALLLVLLFASASIVFSQARERAAQDERHYISLTQGQLFAPQQNRFAVIPVFKALAATLQEDSTPAHTHEHIASDDEQYWTTDTDIEIFHLRYDNNGDLVYTVQTQKNDNVFAPGTGDDYKFTLFNDKDCTLKYGLEIEAFYENTDGLWLPIEARLYDHTGTWLVGDADTWPDVKELNGYKETGWIDANHERDYTLEWRWPFERFDGEGLDANDAYDTMLGNLAVDEDLVLHVVIKTWAECDATADITVTPEPTVTPTPSVTPSDAPEIPTVTPKAPDSAKEPSVTPISKPVRSADGTVTVYDRGKVNTGDYSDANAWIITGCITSGVLIIMLFVLIRSKKKRGR